MIHIAFGIHNPWQRVFKNIWNRETENWEINKE
jgi:hypothetical protein